MLFFREIRFQTEVRARKPNMKSLPKKYVKIKTSKNKNGQANTIRIVLVSCGFLTRAVQESGHPGRGANKRQKSEAEFFTAALNFLDLQAIVTSLGNIWAPSRTVTQIK